MNTNLKMENIKEVFAAVQTASRRYANKETDADDLTQLVMQKLLTSKSVRTEFPRSYLIQIVKYTAFDLHRKTKRKRIREVLASDSMFQDGGPEDLHLTYEAILGKNDDEIDYFMLEEIRRSLSNLSKNHRETLLPCRSAVYRLELNEPMEIADLAEQLLSRLSLVDKFACRETARHDPPH